MSKKGNSLKVGDVVEVYERAGDETPIALAKVLEIIDSKEESKVRSRYIAKIAIEPISLTVIKDKRVKNAFTILDW